MVYVKFFRNDGDVEDYSFRNVKEALEYVSYFDETDKDLYRDIVVYDSGDSAIFRVW